ncbi:MAG: hypothetical protein ABSE56_01550 [Bryobacteraceae bacterium]|jgi:hypothetical protein
MGTDRCFSRHDRFDLAVRENIHRAVQQCDYEPETYLLLVGRYGGLQAAKRLLADPVSDDSLQLWARGRGDLAIEALARSDQWKDLFSADEQLVVERRCAEWLSAPAASELVAQVLTEAVNPLLLDPESDIAWGE